MKLKKRGENMPKIIKYILFAILGLFVIVFVVPFMIGFLSTVNPKKSIEMAQQKTNESKLQSIGGSAYIFYYPNNYVKSQLGDKGILNYQNSTTKAVEPESIFLKVENVGKELPSPTYQSCLNIAESMRRKAEDEIKAEVVRGGFGDKNGVGCKMTMKMPIAGVNDAVMIVQKSLWNETGSDNSIYSVRALYYSNASRGEADILNLAVDRFELK